MKLPLLPKESRYSAAPACQSVTARSGRLATWLVARVTQNPGTGSAGGARAGNEPEVTALVSAIGRAAGRVVTSPGPWPSTAADRPSLNDCFQWQTAQWSRTAPVGMEPIAAAPRPAFAATLGSHPGSLGVAA